MPQVLKASLPVFELEGALAAAKGKLTGAGKDLSDLNSMMGGTFGFMHFLESQPKHAQDSMESTISQLRFDVFRPAADSLRTVVSPSFVQQADESLQSCSSGSTSS